MKRGDIVWCTIKSWGNKHNRPCVILEVLDDTLKVLPISSKYKEDNTIVKMNEWEEASCDTIYYDCGGKNIFGFLKNDVQIVDIEFCSGPTEVCDCMITNRLKAILIKKGFEF